MPTPKAERTVRATARLISREDAKQQLAIAETDTSHDDYLDDLIELAEEKAEHDTGIVGVSSTFVQQLDCWPGVDYIELDVRPVSSITSIQYVDTAGVTQTWASSNYSLDNNRVTPAIFQAYNVDWPLVRDDRNVIVITFVAGYADPTAAPAMLQHAVRLALAREFEDRVGTSIQMGRDDAYEALTNRLARATYP